MVAALGMLLLVPAAAQAKWLRAESPRFNVYSDGDERTLRDYAVKLEDFDTLLRVFYGLDPAGMPGRKLDIYLVGNSEQLRRVSPSASDSLAGFYTASSNNILAIAIRERGDPDADDTIFHEYAHHFMMQNLVGAYPGWLIEGFAEYYMTARLTPTMFEIGNLNKGRAYTLMNGDWTPTTVVLTKRSGELKGEQVFGYYAQAWIMTHYMLADPVRKKQLFAYARALGAGKESVAAWTEATGESIAEFDAKLQKYFRGRSGILSTRFKRIAYNPASVTMSILPPAADDLLLEGLRVSLGRAPDKDPEFLAKIRTRAAKYPADPLAQTILAQTELEVGDKAAGMAILDRMMAADPQAAEALRLKAIAILEAADDEDDDERRRALYNEAGRLLVRANKAQPDEYRTLYAYARSRRFERGWPSDNVVEVLMTSTMLAPQVDEIRVETARALIVRKQYDDAVPLLTPVANDPHGGGASEVARTLLRQISSYVTRGAAQ